MNTKLIAGIAAVLIIAGGAYWYMAASSSGAGEALPESGVPSGKIVFAWNFSDATDPARPDTPRTKVVLSVGENAYVAGEFDGACAEIGDTAWEYLENERNGVICWWAGGGREIGIFEEGGSLVMKVGDLDEGSAETPGMRGGFQTIAVIE